MADISDGGGEMAGGAAGKGVPDSTRQGHRATRYMVGLLVRRTPLLLDPLSESCY